MATIIVIYHLCMVNLKKKKAENQKHKSNKRGIHTHNHFSFLLIDSKLQT